MSISRGKRDRKSWRVCSRHSLKRSFEHKVSSEGLFGRYFKINKNLGVKILTEYSCCSKKELKSSPIWAKAEKELEYLRIAYPLGFSPKPYFVKAIKYGTEFHAGVFMEHIEGVTFQEAYKIKRIQKRIYGDDEDYDRKKEVHLRLKNIFKAKYKTVGMERSDLHMGNMMIDTKGRIKIIDFGVVGVELFDVKRA